MSIISNNALPNLDLNNLGGANINDNPLTNMEGVLPDPIEMVNFQNSLHEYITTTTVASKVVGSAIKGLNELLHPQ